MGNPNWNRRRFIKGAAALSGSGLLMGLYSWQIEPHWLEFVHLKMPINNLPNNLKGKKLMQLSDIHVGPLVDQKFLLNAMEMAKRERPDYVVYTGDFIHFENYSTFDQLEAVMDLAPKGTLGTYAILGNHDYGEEWLDDTIATKIIEILAANKITVLRNEIAENNGLTFIGLDDYWGTNFAPDRAMENYRPNKPTVVLCHNPDVCDLNVWNNYKGWILSGHTHGGQCKPPFLKPPILPVQNPNYDAGIKDLQDGRTLYINRALGHLYQIRFNVRPEITIFTLS
ncbi:metallophosphoesterase [Croceivirga radicis]|uniref:metallophosphoesterase n=1 Tax=Croceivirga radicis TaxID=1929488 RepID=UPI000255AC87|nr:metallophosphoesterase [Croceivirga radicis]